MYIKHPQFNYQVLVPAHGKFNHLLNEVQSLSLLSSDRMYYLLSLLLQTKTIKGDIAECGVFKGGSAKAIASCLEQYHISKKLFLFDTFEGCPAQTITAGDFHKANDFKEANYQTVQQQLKRFSNIEIIPGVLPETLTAIEDHRFSFAHLDLDNYLPTLNTLEFFYPRMNMGGIIVIDDYGFPIYKDSVKKALDEFCERHQICPIILLSGQAFLIKQIINESTY